MDVNIENQQSESYCVASIAADLNKRMSTHINSMCATEDEVSLAFLLCEIDRLKGVIEEVHSWAVCAGIATAKDMAENFPRIVEITDTAAR